MDSKPMECGSMGMMAGDGHANRMLCPPLERLKQEHVVLREKMDRFHSLAERIAGDPNEESDRRLSELRELIAGFYDELEAHSEKEENHLFTAMARYIGREVGPIAVMEYEHDQARKTLQQFLEETKEPLSAEAKENAKSIASGAIQAYSILSVHFMKEENILFPMADHMLSEEEKAKLDQNI
jgi:hemerythrin-like domain-containing protein